MINNKVKRNCDECKHLSWKLKEGKSINGPVDNHRIYNCNIQNLYGIYETAEGKHEPYNAYRSCEYFEQK